MRVWVVPPPGPRAGTRPATAGPGSTGGADRSRRSTGAAAGGLGGGATASGHALTRKNMPCGAARGRGTCLVLGARYASIRDPAGPDRLVDISHRWTSSLPMLRMRHVGRPLAAAIFTFGVASNERLRTAPHRAHRYGPPPVGRIFVSPQRPA